MRALKIFGYLAVAVVGVMVLVFSFVRPSFPVKRFLTDREGKTYDIVVVGKEAGRLVVEPEGIPNPLEIPIQSLKFKDWLFAHWLPDQKPPPIHELPIDRTIMSSDGRALKARIIGKKRDALVVERTSDNMRFEIALMDLSEPDKRFASRIRIEEATEPDYVERRWALIGELKERAELYRKEIDSQTLTKNVHDKRVQDLAAVEKEIRELEVAIENYKFRTRSK